MKTEKIEKQLVYTLKYNRVMFDITDFAVVKLEQENKYFIIKCRYQTDNISPMYGDIISEENFKKLNFQANRQIILSDRYINVKEL